MCLRIYISGLVFLLLVQTIEARVRNCTELDFCTETAQCLLFDPICENENYEVRHYGSVKWVSTDETSSFMWMAANEAFRRLYQHISGDNESGQKIDMASPVIVKIKNKFGKKDYIMSFLLPAEHQENPLKPNNSKVYINDMPDMNVYVRSYGGWMSSLADFVYSIILFLALVKDGATFKKDFHFAAGYNSPMTIWDRHNEVWFVAEGPPLCR
ncbi:hypothetical protein LDENG_00065370 [Lucifuga dentata]|nr:hypothetical protein LDENG_00065370 [Lucifuga dentata]